MANRISSRIQHPPDLTERGEARSDARETNSSLPVSGVSGAKSGARNTGHRHRARCESAPPTATTSRAGCELARFDTIRSCKPIFSLASLFARFDTFVTEFVPRTTGNAMPGEYVL